MTKETWNELLNENSEGIKEVSMYPKYLVFSGEGDRGTWAIYTGKDSLQAIKTRLTKERCNGDRWASIWRLTDMVDKYTGNPVYVTFDPSDNPDLIRDTRSVDVFTLNK